MSFVEGWESKFFISKWCMQQLVCFYILPIHPDPIVCVFHVDTTIFSFEKKAENIFFLPQLLECPSIYELLANPNFQWKDTPLLQIWRENLDNNGKKSALLESYEPAEAIKMIEKALSNNEVSHLRFKLWYDSAYVDAYSFCKFCNGRSLLMECIFLCPLIWIY